MEALFLFLKGIVIGISFAIPIGPTGVLCVQRSLVNGRLSGLMTGFGAATADGIYGGAAIFGLAFALRLIDAWYTPIHLIGGGILIYLAIKHLVQEPTPITTQDVKYNGLMSDYASGLMLTLTNPTNIFSFLAIFAGFNIRVSNGTAISAVATLVGITIGSGIWWLILSYAASAARKYIQTKGFRVINYISVGILMTFGILSLVTLRR